MKAKEIKTGNVITPDKKEKSPLYPVTSYASYKKSKERDKRRGYNFATSTALLENVISKKDIDLFTGNLPQGATPTDTQLDLVDKKGKRVILTTRQKKIILALAQIVDAFKDNKDVADYIKALPDNIEWKKEHNSPVSATIDVIKLAKVIYGSQRIGTKQVDAIRDDLTELSNTRQEFKVRDSKGGTLTMESPVLVLGKSLKYETKDGVVRNNVVQITIEDIFLYELNTKGGYQLSPNTILSLWVETGNNTELCAIILFLLLRVRGNYVSKAVSKSEEKRKELQKKKVQADSLNKQVQEYKRELLTYRETTYSILERLSQDTYYDMKGKKRYLRKAKLSNDLTQSINALKNMGIITDFYTSKSIEGDELCNFVLNDKWIQEQEERQRAILPPEEIKEIDESIAKEKEVNNIN